MKKFLLLILVFALVVSMVPMGAFSFNVSAATSGITGECSWSFDGATFTVSGKGKMGDYDYSSSPWGSIKSDIVKVVIKQGVTGIGNSAFDDCTNLKEVEFGSDVTNIGAYAFKGCNFQKLVLNDKLARIGWSAFSGCNNLEKIEIPDSVVSLSSYAFYGCKKLSEIKVGSGLAAIGESVFEHCSRLAIIEVSQDNTHFRSVDGVLFDKSLKTLMQYPACKKSKHYDIPDTVKNINEWAFGYCRFLESATVPEGVKEIGRCTFDYCRVLKKITLPDSLKTIGYMAFQDCASLKSIQIPDGVTEIADYAFQGCESLSTINLPDSVSSIGVFAFAWCDNLKEVWYTGDETDSSDIAFGTYNNSIKNARWYYNVCDYYQHKYDNVCDGDCNRCLWERNPHIYDNSCDLICNICGDKKSLAVHSHNSCFTDYEQNIKISGKWENTPIKSGVYGIDPYVYSSDFSYHFLRVVDKNNEEVIYNEKRGGWPLVKGQTYTLQLVYQYDETPMSDMIFKSSERTDKLFPDTDADEWYNDAVNYVLGKELMTGYGSNGNFGTADGIQRQDFLVILARLDKVNLAFYQRHDNTFPDMQRNSYYESAVMWGYDNEIVTGYENGDFGVGDKITREQLVTFLYRYAEYKGSDVSYTAAEKNKVKRTYTDYKNVSAYAQDAIIWAVTNGVINGKTDSVIAPQGNALRCEVAQIIYNIFLNELF